uniref:TRAP transporter substrate-binding protein n=1 Tax=Ningiella ruwaisensis TaxID=2364274 RepID=UPI0010A08E44|nr:TRAP transporter substrate-binding protein [Ningiella ruwaisensis]
MNDKCFFRIALILSAVFLLSACERSQSIVEIKLGHGLDTQHPVHQGMEHMAKRLDELSDGNMQISIYPSQQLGTERQTLELLQVGSVGMTKVSAAVLENFAPDMKVFGLPYMFTGLEHAYAVYDGEIGKALLRESEPFYLRGLTYYDAGSRSFYSTDKPIKSPSDLQGMKIRVQPSVTAMNMVRQMGGSPTPIAWGELYTALQQGVVDGAENNPPSFYLSRHYEVSRFYTLNEHTFVPDVLVISTHVWNSLNEQQQKWVQQAADESRLVQRKLWKEAEALALAEVKAAGVTVTYPDKAPFSQAVATMFDNYKDEPKTMYYIQRIRALGEELKALKTTNERVEE